MKELSKYILENVNKHNDNIYSCTTIDGNACTFYIKCRKTHRSLACVM